MQLERSVTTDLPQAVVFHYLAGFHRVIEWDPSVTRAEKRTRGTVTTGTEFEVDVQFLGQTSTLVYQVLEHQPPTRLVLQGKADAYTVTDTIQFETLPNGKTRLTYGLQVVYAPGYEKLAGVFAPLVRSNVDTAIAVLERTLNYQPQPVKHYPQWRDKLVLPGMLEFTRRGYVRGKQHWAGLLFDLAGKNIVITGATSGLGRAAALALADMGANVIAVARDSNKAADLQQAVRDHCGREIRVLLGDMNRIAQTRAVAQTLLAEDQPIDVLINNAGALFNQRDVTAEGFEKSLALLLLSPFVLTESLLPLLRKRGGRVVNVVSGGLYTQPIRLDDLHYEKGTYNGAKAYARAKRGLLDMTRRWAQQPENAGVVFHAMHPGWADTQAVMDSLPGFYRITKPFLRDTVQGADTIVWLASAPEPATCNGGFWLDRQLHASAIFANTETSPANREQLYRMLQDLAATVPIPN